MIQEDKIRNSERFKIGQELHDILANELLHLHFLLFKTEDQLEHEVFHQLSDRVNYIRKQVRLLSHNLIKPYNTSFGNFLKSVKTLLIDYTYFSPETTFEFNFYPKEIHLSPHIEEELMVVLKEIINNALLHGKAQHIDLNIIDHQDELSIIIEDDGVGFDVNSEKLGVGLSNIKHRIKSIDGTVNVDSMIGTGTVFNLNICKNENISC